MDGRAICWNSQKGLKEELSLNEKTISPHPIKWKPPRTGADGKPGCCYDMTFLGLHTFDHWGQSCTTGIFEKDGREFVFVPGDTVTLGWEQFAVGLNQESREELDYLFQGMGDGTAEPGGG